MQYTIQSIATVRNNRQMIKDDHWGEIISTIELADHIQEASLKGIEDFSHLEVIFYFDKVTDDQIQYEARHPRNNDVILRSAFLHKEVRIDLIN